MITTVLLLKIGLTVLLLPFIIYTIARIIAKAVYKTKNESLKTFMNKESTNEKKNTEI